MKNAAEEAKARTSMSSTFGSVMNPDARDFKLSLDQLMKQRKRGFIHDEEDSDGMDVVSFSLSLSKFHVIEIGNYGRDDFQTVHDQGVW